MSKSENQVSYLTPANTDFEERYKFIRNKEGRWLSDEDVKRLPRVNFNDPLQNEWKKRSWMLNKFETYMSLASTNKVLDIGCGNGWMTNRISSHCESITGVDVGAEELEQAARCFSSETVHFACCSDWSLLPQNEFDLIYFAGSFHYFQPDTIFWEQLYSLLKPGGEIHIIETKFYTPEELEEAKVRSRNYFENLGVNIDYYHHLTWELLPDPHDVLYKPDLRNKIFKNRSPFPWIRIRK